MDDTRENHEGWIRKAIAVARNSWGETHPNPLVGALIVENGTVLAEGWHTRAGEPHAEVLAIDSLSGRDLSTSTLYVTLEPCSTHGRTSPCTDAILAARIPRVVIGAIDPNPAHRGRGIDRLRTGGVEVVTGILEAGRTRPSTYPVWFRWNTHW